MHYSRWTEKSYRANKLTMLVVRESMLSWWQREELFNGELLTGAPFHSQEIKSGQCFRIKMSKSSIFCKTLAENDKMKQDTVEMLFSLNKLKCGSLNAATGLQGNGNGQRRKISHLRSRDRLDLLISKNSLANQFSSGSKCEADCDSGYSSNSSSISKHVQVCIYCFRSLTHIICSRQSARHYQENNISIIPLM